MLFIALILGAALAACVAFFLVMFYVCRSNKLGDEKGDFFDFAYAMEYIQKRDNIKSSECKQYVAASNMRK